MPDKMDDKELLRLLALERTAAIGFENDAELSKDREQALNYFKGEMPDVPALPNRSKAVQNDLAEAVETLLPDIIEIFLGGSDVLAFSPRGEEDEEAAKQETDYLHHVVFNENDGFTLLYSMFKDAALEKTGLAAFYWCDRHEEETFEGKTLDELALVAQGGAEIRKPDGSEFTAADAADPNGKYDFTAAYDRSYAKAEAFAPEDFAVAADTVALRDATYCCFRSRPRAQQLLADGVPEDVVAQLGPYNPVGDTQTEQARDTASETDNATTEGGPGNLRQVELFTHFLRCDYEGTGKLQVIRVVTGNGEKVIVEGPDVVNRVQVAAITPFITPHRFYGLSLADKLIETMRIRTALTRMLLDSGYFALNQRVEVAMDKAHPQFTIADLLRNEPGVPIRTKTGEAVRPIAAGALAFDAMGALEYFATVKEGQTGIVRNAQGLNPDTLHETAKGAMALMTMAQKRVRMIARIFAETGLKDLFLGLHALIREHATKDSMVRLRGKWVKVDPTSWGERNDMTIELGLGAGGREHDQMMAGQIVEATKGVIELQGGLEGPFVTPSNAYNVLKNFYEKLGVKTPELYVSDPSDPNTPKPTPKPDPEIVKAQLEHERKMKQMQAEFDLKREQMAGEFQLERYKIDTEAKAKVAVGMMGGTGPSPSLPNVRQGGAVG
jgi:hypothetical protein